jgi:hypothetical protein
MTPTAILITAAALTGATGERLAAPALPDYVTGYEAADPRYDMAIREEVRQGETVEAWTHMVTTQRFGTLAAKITPVDFARDVARRMIAACPGAKATSPDPLTLAGHPAVRLEVACPLLAQTGKSETMLLLAITGPRDLHVKQVAFRGGQTAADLDWGRRFLDRVSLCVAGETAAGCGN